MRRFFSGGSEPSESAEILSFRPLFVGIALFTLLGMVPTASAHGEYSDFFLSQFQALLIALAGVGVVAVSVYSKRSDRVRNTTALYGVLAGIVVATVGAVLFEGLAPDPTYTAGSMPFPRLWYTPLSLGVGIATAVASLTIGLVRWPTRPQYTFLGILIGLWVAYPSLIPGPASDTHPLGYAIVFSMPLLVGYIVWTDAKGVLRRTLQRPFARRFGLGVGAIAAFFFISASNYLSFFPEQGIPQKVNVDVLPVIYPLVTWQTLEIYLPQVPMFAAMSVGLAILVGTVSVLIGLNAALVARQWRAEGMASGGTAQGTAGPTAFVGSCACGCCGPIVAQVAILAVGPSVAAPLYWLFVDPMSPFASVFLVGSILLFTGSIVYATNSMQTSDSASRAMSTDAVDEA